MAMEIRKGFAKLKFEFEFEFVTRVWFDGWILYCRFESRCVGDLEIG